MLSRNVLKSTEDFKHFSLPQLQFLGLFGNYIEGTGSYEDLASFFTQKLTILSHSCPSLQSLSIDGNPLSEKLLDFEGTQIEDCLVDEERAVQLLSLIHI